MKKVLTSFALVSALASSAALAEQSGAFVGIDGGYASHKAKITGEGSDSASGFKGFRYGLVGGYKYFLDDNLGFRGYVNLTTGTKNTTGDTGPSLSTGQITRFDIGINADVLYNFLQSGDFEYGAFGGLSLDYASNKYKHKELSVKPKGIDFGINLGLRMNYTQTHGFELWSRFGLNDTKKSVTWEDGSSDDLKIRQPYAVGLRYTFNF
ncbi:hypothetical protein DMB95_03915 [Campylobacter sp. MIT 12-8780]|uniref:outer membrane beta-barrel protein n=1 Tax=unclassified Campylobacter TaxID=2593542 RepID=UPI00115E5225|nr:MULTISPECIES: outer membrane beta-barrel protein [unclassified Campylobacter]NDJ27194.1 outer membrane beta-barrel protein [Campylobacter sp. MIT 19-121]TQR41510.1 hypothetical protein DMB95_03915 [Campylobacter sp. MIT 12-8780]